MMQHASADRTTHVIPAQKDPQRAHTAAHQPDSAGLAEKQGLTATPTPTGYITEETKTVTQWLPNASNLGKSSIAIRECLDTLIP